jgi:hypothetical protein
MQSILSPGMVPVGKARESLGLTTAHDLDDSPTPRFAGVSSDPGALANALAIVAAHQAAESAQLKRVVHTNHFPVTPLVDGKQARFVCACGEDTGWHLTECAIANAATHQTLAKVEQERLSELDSHCEPSESPVVYASRSFSDVLSEVAQ